MARRDDIAIDLDSLTIQDWADVREIAAAAGVDAGAVDLAAPPVPVLAGLIFVTLRRTNPRVTAGRCVRLALAHVAAPPVPGVTREGVADAG